MFENIVTINVYIRIETDYNQREILCTFTFKRENREGRKKRKKNCAIVCYSTTRDVMARGQSWPETHTALLMNAIEVIWWTM